MTGRFATATGALDPATSAVRATALQATATGGSPVVVLGLLGVAVATGLSLLIAYHALRGYRGSDDTGMLLLAVGIVLLTAGPNTLRLVLPTFTVAPESLRLLAATGSELLGLACMLLAIYGRPRQ
ncbi:MAG: hypothetical protein V5A28_14505 [Haloarculaceae archaeon]